MKLKLAAVALLSLLSLGAMAQKTVVYSLPAVSTPTAPTVVATCSGGCSTSWGYAVVAVNSVGGVTSNETVITNGAATLDNTHYNTIFTPTVSNADACQIWRVTSPDSFAANSYEGYITSVSCGSSYQDKGTALFDYGVRAYPPMVNTSQGAVLSNLRVTGNASFGTANPNKASGWGYAGPTTAVNIQNTLSSQVINSVAALTSFQYVDENVDDTVTQAIYGLQTGSFTTPGNTHAVPGLIGAYFYAYHQGSGSFNHLQTFSGEFISLETDTENNGGAQVDRMQGIANSVSNNLGTVLSPGETLESNPTVGIQGYHGGMTNSSGDVDFMRDLVVNAESRVYSGVVKNAVGVQIWNVSSVGGTVTNNYGLYINPIIGGTALNYQIYSNGTAPSFFRGPIQASAFQETLFTPASSSAACTTGQFADDANFHYVCTATNTWKRVALSTF